MKCAALVLLFLTPLLRAEEPKKPPAATLEARLSDGSRIHLALLDDSIPIQTPHGKLTIPLADVRRVDLGTRLPEALLKQIDSAIADLGSSEHAKRESAGEKLIKIGPRAYPALVRACKSADREQALSAKRLRDKFVDAYPEERLPEHDLDVVHTDEAKIAGRIEVSTLRVWTAQFGEKTLKLNDLVSVRSIAAHDTDDVVANVQPDPGNLSNFAEQRGKSFYFTVTGNPNGTIYGTDLYTTDSQLSTAAVHAGVLRSGETGTVKVTIVDGQQSYNSTTRNGVTSNGWNQYPSSYKVSKVKK